MNLAVSYVQQKRVGKQVYGNSKYLPPFDPQPKAGDMLNLRKGKACPRTQTLSGEVKETNMWIDLVKTPQNVYDNVIKTMVV